MNFLFVKLTILNNITNYDIPNTGNLVHMCCNVKAGMNDYNRNRTHKEFMCVQHTCLSFKIYKFSQYITCIF